MRTTSYFTAFAILVATGTGVDTAFAKSAWQKPTVVECNMGPGADCNVEVSCPADMPYLVVGGGGIPKIEPAGHSIAMTMNLPIKKDTWRVRWRNLSADQTATGKFAVRVKCSDTAAEAGW